MQCAGVQGVGDCVLLVVCHLVGPGYGRCNMASIQFIQVTVEPHWCASRNLGPTKQLSIKVRTSDGLDHKVTEMWDEDDFVANFEYMMEKVTKMIMRHMKKEKSDEKEKIDE